jgi:putative transcriptional regulator
MTSQTRHHPEGEYLLDYATGAAPHSVALLIATHLALCLECRRAVRALEAVSAESLEAATTSDIRSSVDFANLPPQEVWRPARDERDSSYVFPEPLRSYAGGDAGDLTWRRTVVGTKEIALPNRDGHEVKLVQLPRRSLVMPTHTHAGSELMLVLQGAFKDETGRYERGDVSNGDPSLVHRPIAVGAATCICLTVVDGPLLPVGGRGRILTWLQSIKPKLSRGT